MYVSKLAQQLGILLAGIAVFCFFAFTFPETTFAAPMACPTGTGWTSVASSPLVNCNFNGNFRGYADPRREAITCNDGSTPLLVSINVQSVNGQNCVSNTTSELVTTPRPATSGTESSSTEIAACARSGIVSGTWGDVGNCFLATISVGVGSALISIFTSLIWLAESFFTLVVTKTVLTDGFATLYDSIRTSVESTWTLFRDLANIAIIGFFVFIAISMILGIKEYGEKKLVARVLIVAVLINFSFLFTRIVINASNSLSTGIYNNMIVSIMANQRTSDGRQMSIGDKYIKDLKIPSIADAARTLTSKYTEKDGVGPIWMHVLVASTVGIILTIALLFGAFMLAIRFITLIALLFLSSVAFASVLLPNTKALIWDRWWSALWKNALLAPVFFIFLWASLQISNGVGQAATGSFGSIGIGKPATESMMLFLNYLIIIGFLIIGIILSKTLSGHLALKLTGASLAAPAGLAASALGFGRNIYALRRQKGIEKRMEKIKRMPFAKGLKEEELERAAASRKQALMPLADKAIKYKEKSNKAFNPFNNSLVKAGMKSAFGLSGLAAGQTKLPTYAKVVENQGKRIGERAAKLELSAADKDAQKKSQMAQYEQAKKQTEDIRATKETQKAQLSATKDGVKATKEAAEAQMKAAHDQNKAADVHRETEMTKIKTEDKEDAVKIVTGTPPEQEAAKDRLSRNAKLANEIMAERIKKSIDPDELKRRDAHLQEVNQKFSTISQEFDTADRELRESAAAAEKAAADLKNADKVIGEHVAKAANIYGKGIGAMIDRSTWNQDFADAAKKHIREHHDHEFFKKLAKATKVGDTHDDKPATGAATNAKPADDHGH